MTRMSACGLAVLLAACALPQGVSAETPLSERPALDFSQVITTEGLGEDTAFARSVAKRYGAGLTREAVIADAKAQGFNCDVTGESCTRTAMDGPCADAWIVDFNDDASITGRHVKRCMGAEADDE